MRENYKIDEKSAYLTKLETLKRILSYFSSYKKRIVFIVLMIIAMSLIISVIPLFTERAVDVDINNKDAKGLVFTISAAIGLCLIWWLLSVLKQHMLAKLTNEIVYRIRKETYDNVLRLSLEYFDTRPSGRILARIVGDMDGLKTISQQLVNDFIPNIVLLIFILAIMVYVNIKLSIAAFVVIPILSFSSYWIIYRGYPNWEMARKKESNHTSFIYEDYSGIRVIQSYSAEKETEEEENRLLQDIKDSWKKAVRFSDKLNIITLSSQGLGYFLLFVIAIKYLKMDSGSLGEILAYAGYMGLFWQPIRSLASMYTQLVNNLSSAARVFELMDEKSTLVEDVDAKDIVVNKGSVVFDNISFCYPDEKDRLILEDLSFSVEDGMKIALVGATGAGKTTIINLLSRFYAPTKGRILIDGEDISKATFSSLHRAIAIMPQDSIIFKGTIRDNLLYGKDVSDDVMVSACRQIGIDEMILSLPYGYDTEVAKVSLSQGQKQLIALARTLIVSPKVLILDEATSNVDTNTEMMVQKGLEILMAGRTTFVVAHRLSTIKNADEIFVISNRGISERGNHQTLMSLNGEYRSLYDAQFALMQ